ncbi:hypothetical protein BJY04DRAFT_183274 [Aspergillus karnatakaensis]|uniref:uncharacterized protein n=1 Tax=Aspergillus karnatakaensis TaxID=1810916 RepID=UPI003CCE19B1
MAETSHENVKESFTIPPYPEDLDSEEAERVSDDELQRIRASLSNKAHHHVSPVAESPNMFVKWHETQETVYVRSGAFEFGQEMNVGNTIVHCYLNGYSSSYRSSKNDNTSFNLYTGSGSICLHISFRRHVQQIIFNEYTNGRWGRETYIDFPDCIKNESSVDMAVYYQGDGMSIVDFNTEGWRVSHGGAADSLTYRANNSDDAMFGNSLTAQFSWRS